MGCNPENMKQKQLVKIVHYYSDGSRAVLEGEGIRAYQHNMSLAAQFVISHAKQMVMKEDWKEIRGRKRRWGINKT